MPGFSFRHRVGVLVLRGGWGGSFFSPLCTNAYARQTRRTPFDFWEWLGSGSLRLTQGWRSMSAQIDNACSANTKG